MVLEIPGKILGQSDVRETPTDKLLQGNFNSTDFTVTEGVVTLATKTSYWTCPGTNFVAELSSVDLNIYRGWGASEMGEDNLSMLAPIFLPHGAVITAVQVYGNAGAAAETWEMFRANQSGTQTTMATANIGTGDTSITDDTVDNENYFYFFTTSSLDTGDTIYGAKITYTTTTPLAGESSRGKLELIEHVAVSGNITFNNISGYEYLYLVLNLGAGSAAINMTINDLGGTLYDYLHISSSAKTNVTGASSMQLFEGRSTHMHCGNLMIGVDDTKGMVTVAANLGNEGTRLRMVSARVNTAGDVTKLVITGMTLTGFATLYGVKHT